jgi:alkylation response protein AidB-like acyl-CoA dehydrogenase
MEFSFSEEHNLLREMVRDFTDHELIPLAPQLDEKEEFPVENLKRLAELGLMGVVIPDEYGGSGMDTISLAIALQEVGRGCASTAVTSSVNNLVAQGINAFVFEEQKIVLLCRLYQTLPILP